MQWLIFCHVLSHEGLQLTQKNKVDCAFQTDAKPLPSPPERILLSFARYACGASDLERDCRSESCCHFFPRVN